MATGTGGWVGGDDWYAKVDASVTTNSAASAVITIKCICVSQYGTTSGYNNIRGATAKGSDSWGWSSATSISTNSTKTLRTTTHTINKNHSAQSIKCWAKVEGIAGVYSGSSSTASVNVTVSAKTSYAVSYNGNGGTLNAKTTAQTKWYNEALTLHGGTTSSPSPTRTGYTFVKWNTKEDGTGTSYNAAASYTGNAALTLYAIWKANTYTVAYNANKPSAATGSVTNLPASQTKTYGTTLKLSSNVPVLPLYNFLGYATSASGAVAYQPGANYTSNAAATLYAKWELAYTVPSPPTNVTATNIYDGVVSNTKCDISFTLPNVTDMGHRTGYNVYVDGVLVSPYTNSYQTEQTITLSDFDISDHAGKAIVISVACVGEAGISTKVVAATLYGRLAAPTVTSISRGWSSALGYYANVSVADSGSNVYGHSVVTNINGDTYTGVGTFTITSITGDSAWVNSPLVAYSYAVPTDVGYQSENSVSVTSPKATYAPRNLDVSQVMDGSVAYARVVFDGAVGEDYGTEYHISFSGGLASVDMEYDSEGYSYDQVYMSAETLTITVYATRNGWRSGDVSITFTYVPQTFRAPTLLGINNVDGTEFSASFTDAKYGIPIQEGSVDGYGYELYVGGAKVAEESWVGISSDPHTLTFYVYDPNQSLVQMRAIDLEGYSPYSNSMKVKRTVAGTGIYAYNTKLDVERVSVGGVLVAMTTRNVNASIGNCEFASETIYNMELDTDVITERDNKYVTTEE